LPTILHFTQFSKSAKSLFHRPEWMENNSLVGWANVFLFAHAPMKMKRQMKCHLYFNDFGGQQKTVAHPTKTAIKLRNVYWNPNLQIWMISLQSQTLPNLKDSRF
jgi:hypothetical protein